MTIDLKMLQSLALFETLRPEELEQIQGLVRLMTVTEGDVLTRRDTPAKTFFINISGNFMLAFKHDRAITLHQKGDILGWSTVKTPFRHSATAVALTNGDVLALPGEDFFRLLQGNNALGDKIMRKISVIASERLRLISDAEARYPESIGL